MIDCFMGLDVASKSRVAHSFESCLFVEMVVVFDGKGFVFDGMGVVFE